jgi:uncharacterized damage-inducible protein DinB
MTDIERIVDRYDRAMEGDAWHGDPVWKVLAGVSPEVASQRPAAGAHTIWELVEHMTFWETVISQRLTGDRSQPDQARNFPVMPAATEENWKNTLDAFRKSNAEFRDALSKLEESRLDQPLSSAEKTAYIEVNGVIEHDLYHAGQIALLRKF